MPLLKSPRPVRPRTRAGVDASGVAADTAFGSTNGIRTVSFPLVASISRSDDIDTIDGASLDLTPADVLKDR